MPLPKKEVTCPCGHTSVLTQPKLLCVQCGKYVFYDAQVQRRHRIRSFYGLAMLAVGLTLVTYFFIEMIVEPLFRR